MSSGDMTLEEIWPAYVKVQAELASQKAENEWLASKNVSSKASVEILQKELESAKSSKYQSRFKPSGRARQLMFKFGDEDDVTPSDDEEPTENDGGEPDPLTHRLKFLEKQSSLMLKLMSKLPGAPTLVETEPTNGNAASPFCKEIVRVTVPHQLRIYLPIYFWRECVLVATHLINNTPSTLLQNKTPFDI